VILQLTVKVTFEQELDFLKQNWVSLQSGVNLPHFLPSSLAQRYVSGVIQTSLELTVTVTCDPELDFLKKGTGLCLQSGIHLTHFLPSSLA
jgi:hypothetical protein